MRIVRKVETHCDVAAGSDDLPLQLAVLRFRIGALVAQQAAGRHKWRRQPNSMSTVQTTMVLCTGSGRSRQSRPSWLEYASHGFELQGASMTRKDAGLLDCCEGST